VAVRPILTVGVTASLAANVLRARPDPVSQAIAAWPPIALLPAIEPISRVPIDRRWLAAIRVAATVGIAAIAVWDQAPGMLLGPPTPAGGVARRGRQRFEDGPCYIDATV
jgi:hypothetical protein